MRVLSVVLIALAAGIPAIFSSRAAQPASDALRYTTDGKLVRPLDYREWIWLSSGFGMSYNPAIGPTGADHPPFDNVFANPAAYRSFLQTGTWPDKTVLILEIRASKDRESINQAGHFQGELVETEAHVKDESRFPGKWAFFAFGRSGNSASAMPTSARCYSCHEQHGAVDTTFVQFYPTLLDIAKQKGTLRGVNP